MTALVLDCSVTMAWCFEDECDPYAEAVLSSLGDAQALVPPIWPLEVVNVLLVAERKKRLHRADSSRFLELLGGLPIIIDQGVSLMKLGGILSRGRELVLSAYDTAYLELAEREGLPVATCDARLRAACKKSGLRLFLG